MMIYSVCLNFIRLFLWFQSAIFGERKNALLLSFVIGKNNEAIGIYWRVIKKNIMIKEIFTAVFQKIPEKTSFQDLDIEINQSRLKTKFSLLKKFFHTNEQKYVYLNINVLHFINNLHALISVAHEWIRLAKESAKNY